MQTYLETLSIEVFVFDDQILRVQTRKCIAFNNHNFIVSIFIFFKCVCHLSGSSYLILFLSYSGMTIFYSAVPKR